MAGSTRLVILNKNICIYFMGSKMFPSTSSFGRLPNDFFLCMPFDFVFDPGACATSKCHHSSCSKCPSSWKSGRTTSGWFLRHPAVSLVFLFISLLISVWRFPWILSSSIFAHSALHPMEKSLHQLDMWRERWEIWG